MRATTVLRRVLALADVRVASVELRPEGIVVDVRPLGGRLRCPPCARPRKNLLGVR